MDRRTSARPARAPAAPQESFVDFYGRTYGSAVGMAYLLTNDRPAAVDLVHLAFVDLLRAWDSLADPTAALAEAIHAAVARRPSPRPEPIWSDVGRRVVPLVRHSPDIDDELPTER